MTLRRHTEFQARPSCTTAPRALASLLSALLILGSTAISAASIAGVAPPSKVEPARGSSSRQEPVPTTLVARVTNERGEVIADQQVVVLVVDAEKQIAERLEATTTADGEARFENVSAGTGYAAWAASVYETATYQGEPVVLTPGAEVILPLTVYTVSDTPATLHIDVLHIIINTIEPGVYQAVQVMRVLNVGEQAGFSGQQFEGRPVGLEIPVPDAATSIVPISQFSGLDAANTATQGNRLLDLRPVPPGDHQVAIQYELLTDSDGSEMSLTLPYPTAEVTMLVGPGLGATVIESDQLTELEPVSIPNQGDFANYRSDVIESGGTLRFRLGPPPQPMSMASWALLALAAALFAGALASMLSGRRKVGDAEASGLLADQREQLLAEVARLDDRFESGGLEEADYTAQRSEAIARILDIDQRVGNAPGPDGA